MHDSSSNNILSSTTLCLKFLGNGHFVNCCFLKRSFIKYVNLAEAKINCRRHLGDCLSCAHHLIGKVSEEDIETLIILSSLLNVAYNMSFVERKSVFGISEQVRQTINFVCISVYAFDISCAACI